jgi:hypothetical protein
MTNILDGYQWEREFARDHDIHPRTIARYRNEPDGLPFVEFGGKIFIDVAGARKWIENRTRSRNPRRAA